jgi:gamma-glutamyltranspeptidase/glutathione hydrolase
VTALDFTLPYASSRSPVMGRNVVAASQPLAAQAGLRMLLKGGNAIRLRGSARAVIPEMPKALTGIVANAGACYDPG